MEIPLGKDYVSTFQNLKITEFTVCLTQRPLEKRTTTQYYRTRPSKNFETVNLEIPNSKILKAQTLSKLGIPCSNGLMNVAKWFSVCLILYKLLLKIYLWNFTFYSKLYKLAITSHTLLFTSYSKSFAKERNFFLKLSNLIYTLVQNYSKNLSNGFYLKLVFFSLKIVNWITKV